jgi:hypothetical protein
VNLEEYKELGGYVMFVTGATKVIHWVVKRYDEAQKYNRDIIAKYNKERDDRDGKSDDLYRGLSGVIKEQNNTNAIIIDKLKDHDKILKDLLEHIKYKKS